MKKWSSFFICMMLIAAMLLSYTPVFAEVVQQDENGENAACYHYDCGSKVYYKVEDKVLTIYGEGPMCDFYMGRFMDEFESPWYWKSFTSIVIEPGITHIGAYAFAFCNPSSITIPDTVTSVGYEAFYGCKLNEVVYNGTIQQWKQVEDNSCDGNLTQNPVTCTDGVYNATVAGDNWTLTGGTLTITGNVTGYWFDECLEDWPFSEIPWFTYRKHIREVVIADGVTYIGGGAFLWLNVDRIIIPASVTAFGYYSFYSCHVKNIYYTGTREQWSRISQDDCGFEYDVTPTFSCPHSVGNFISDNNATCTQDGTCTGTCIVCSKTFTQTQTGTALGHSFTNYSSNGYGTMIATCDRCDATDHYRGGDCGSNAWWKLTDDTLTIYGTGEMWDYYGYETVPPWSSSGCTRVVIESGITSICRHAFEWQEEIESVTIPATVTHIGDYAFGECIGVKEIIYGGTIAQWKAVSIGKDDGTLTQNPIACSDGIYNPNVVSGTCGEDLTWTISGTTLTISGTGSMADFWYDPCFEDEPYVDTPWNQYSGRITQLVIEEGVTSISDAAFLWFGQLRELIIPDSVTYIGEYAFRGCGLTDVTIGDGVKFLNCTTFQGCSRLSRLTLGKNVQDVGAGLFETGATLDIYITGPMPIVTSYEYIFEEKKGNYTLHLTQEDLRQLCQSNFNESGYLPNSLIGWADAISVDGEIVTQLVIPEGVTGIGRYVFANCNAVTSVSIPASVTYVGEGAFSGCQNLTDVYYGGNLEDWYTIRIGENNTALERAILHYTGHTHSFRNYISNNDATTTQDGTKTAKCDFCDATDTIVDVGSKLDSYGKGTCGENLQWILKVDGTLHITGTGAMYDFNYDTATKETDIPWYEFRAEIKRIDLGDGITKIGKWAFRDCMITEMIIPEGVTEIGGSAFWLCTALETVEIPVTVTTIGGSAFYKCSSLTAATVPEGVTALGSQTFYQCTKLASITLPKSLTEVGNSAFRGSSALKNVYYAGTREQWDAITIGTYNTPLTNATLHVHTHSFTNYVSDNNATYDADGTKTARCDGCDTTDTIVDEGTQLERPTSGICGQTLFWFYENGVLTVTGSGAMYDFTYDTATKETDIPWYYYRTEITSVVFQGNITKVGKWAFRDCMITEILIPEGVTEIGGSAFWLCTALETVEIPATVTTIGGSAFYKCSSLTTAAVPEGITTLGAQTFYQCTKLASITLPKSLTEVGNSAFRGSSALKNVYYAGTREQWDAITIGTYNTPLTNATLHPHIHSFTNYVSNNDATYFEDGTKTAKCDTCDATDTIVDEGTRIPMPENTIVLQPQSVTAASGEAVQFTVAVSGNIVSYKWEYRKLYKWFETSMDGYNTAALTVPATGARNGYGYRCVITLADGTVLISEPAVLTVNTVIDIVKHPTDQTAVLGHKGQFTVEAQGEGLKYQWQYCRPGSEKWIDTAMEGATKPTVMIETTTARDGYRYRCMITDASGKVVYTEPATMRVLSFASHPEAVFSAPGMDVTFSVTTSVETGFTYQWQYRRPGGNWTNTTMTGYNTATLTVGATLVRNGYEYRCVLTGAKNSKIESKGAILYVAEPVKITQQPVSVTVSSASNAVFTVRADNAYSYQWYYSKNGTNWYVTSADGNQTATLTVAASGKNGYMYRCKIIGLDGSEAYTNPATLTVR